MVAISNSVRWEPSSLKQVAENWVMKMRHKNQASSHKSMWWSYIFTWNKEIESVIASFVTGNYKFSPMITYRIKGQMIHAFAYKDKLILILLRKIIAPVLKWLVPPCCYHLNGPTGIIHAINHVNESFCNKPYRYFIRADIQDFYASINHRILIKKIKAYFFDTRLCKYLTAIITTAIDDGGEVKLPKSGIPRGSSLSPIFGALYLADLDAAFYQNTEISYCRYMDDIVILAKTKRRFLRAKKKLQQILLNLKLKLSRSKTRMGELTNGFHFLGIDFAVSRNQQNKEKIHVTTNLHPRTYRRALDKVKVNAMEEGAVNPAKVLRYLSRWAAWWARVIGTQYCSTKLSCVLFQSIVDGNISSYFRDYNLSLI